MGRPLSSGPRNSRCPSGRGGTRSSRPLRMSMDFCAIADRRSTPDPGLPRHGSRHRSPERAPDRLCRSCTVRGDGRHAQIHWRFHDISLVAREGSARLPQHDGGDAVKQWAIVGCSPVRGVCRPRHPAIWLTSAQDRAASDRGTERQPQCRNFRSAGIMPTGDPPE